MSEIKYNIYLKSDRRNQNIKTTGATQASYIPSDQVAEVRNNIKPEDISAIFANCNNLLKNGDFEQGLANWKLRTPKANVASIVPDNTFGTKAMRLHLNEDHKNFPGIEQTIRVKPNTTYTAMILGKNIGKVVLTVK